MKPGGDWAYDAISSGSTSSHRWYSNDPLSGTAPSSGSQTVSKGYYEQYKKSFGAQVASGGTALSSSNYIPVTIRQFGSTQQLQAYDGHDGTDWADAGSSYSYSQQSTGSSSSERWRSRTQKTGTVTDGNTILWTFYHQYKPSVTLNGTDSSHTVTAYYDQYGSAADQSGQYSSWSDWCDRNSTLTFSQQTTGSPPYETSDPRSWTVTSAFSKTINYEPEEAYIELGLVTGWNLISIGQPVDPNMTFDQLLGSNVWDIYAWDAQVRGYQQVDFSESVGDFVGVGLWVLSSEDQTIEILVKRPPETPVSIQVSYGWNLLGNPFPIEHDLGAGLVPDSGDDVLNEGYIWNGHGYDLLQILPVGKGVWILSTYEGGAEFIFNPPPPPAGASASVVSIQTQPDVPEGSRCIEFAVRSGNLADVGNWFGVTSNGAAVHQAKPPAAPGGLSLYLETNEHGIGYGTYLVPQSDQNHVWQLSVQAPAEQRVELFLPDTSELPGELAVWLQDMTTGQKTDLRHAPSYGYTSDSGHRRFRLWLGERSSFVQIFSLCAQPTTGRVAISFALSAPANVSAVVCNIAGRPIHRLVNDRQYDSGLQALSWNGQSDRGTKVPGGLYLIRMTARGATGEQAQALTTVRLP